jgi:MerR family transcriptional regulator, redox-sensitive transcriptional activator SoxR
VAGELLTIGQVSARSGVAPSALRYYEQQGLIAASRTAGGARRFSRAVLRRLAFVRAAQNVGLSLGEIREALVTLPADRPPTARDWARLSSGWRERLDEQIAALQQLRDGLTSCIGCGCLSLDRCILSNPGDVAAGMGPGARWLSPALRRVPPVSNAG